MHRPLYYTGGHPANTCIMVPCRIKKCYNLVEHHFSVLQQINGHLPDCFYRKRPAGSHYNPYHDGFAAAVCSAIGNQDIRQMLRYLYDEIDRGSVQGMLVRPTSLQLPDYLSIYVHPKTGLHIYTTNAFVYGAYCCNIHIRRSIHLPYFLWFYAVTCRKQSGLFQS